MRKVPVPSAEEIIARRVFYVQFIEIGQAGRQGLYVGEVVPAVRTGKMLPPGDNKKTNDFKKKTCASFWQAIC